MSRRFPALALAFLAPVFAPLWAGPATPLPEGVGGLWEAVEPNLGQGPPEAAFLVRSPRATCLIGPSGLDVYLTAPSSTPGSREGEPACPQLGGTAAFRLRLEEASAGTFRADSPLPGVVHHYHGSDPSRWVTGVPRYGRVVWEAPLPGVEVEFLPLLEGIRFDLRLSPSADPERLGLAVESLDGKPVAFRVGPEGNAAVETALGPFPLRMPAVYAEGKGGRRAVRGTFTLRSPSSLGLRVAGRGAGESLVVDPTLVYSSYLGGYGTEVVQKILLDPAGGAVLAGSTNSADFPGGQIPQGMDAYLAVFSPSGTLDFVALLGGYASDYGEALARDASGDFYLGGNSYSSDFPVLNGFQSDLGGGGDGFVARLGPSGALMYSTLLGGYGGDAVLGVDTGPAGRAYAAGSTASPDFPTTSGAIQPSLQGPQDGFLTVLDTLSSGPPLYSSFIGGSAADEMDAVRTRPDVPDVVFLCGQTYSSNFPVTANGYQQTYQGGGDGVFLEYARAPSPGVLYSTYLGSTGEDHLTALTAYPNGQAAVAGYTESPFPLVSPTQAAYGGGATDAVAALFDPDAPALLFSTYLGGSGADFPYAAAHCTTTFDTDLVVAGATTSPDLPLVDPLPGQESLQGVEDAFLAAWVFPVLAPHRPGEPASGVSPQRTLTTYFGGEGDDWGEAAACLRNPITGVSTLALAGGTTSLALPLAGSPFQGTHGGGSYDAFFALFSTAPACTLTCSASADSSVGVAPFAVSFTATADASGCSQNPLFSWDFGDGGTSTEQNPTHTYAAAGSYTWTLTVTVDSETCTRSGTVKVCELTCTASASEEQGFAPLDVSFTGIAALLGSCGIDTFNPTYDWNFGDGSPHSTLQNPSHTYASPGTYTWTLTVSFGQAVCTQSGTVEVCGLACTASASPSGGVPPLAVSFNGGASTPGSCPLDPLYHWDFGDGGTSTEQNPTHTYASAGTFTWTFTVTQGQAVCTQSGTVQVQPAALYGYVGISGDELFPLDGEGIVSASVTARNTATGAAETVPVLQGFYAFPSLPPGTYTLEATVRYKDFVFVDALFRGLGCPAPSQGYLEKEVTRRRPGTVTVTSSGSVTADVLFPPPLVLLHGALGCYEKWYSADPFQQDYWDNRARAQGLLTFTPHFTWWGESYPWNQRAGEVYQQVQADLHGLNEQAGSVLGVRPYPPWNLLAYDMGGLVARVLTSGNLGTSPVMEALRDLYLLGVPNSGSDFLFGGLGNGLLDTETVVRRFNEVYPDFGPWTERVYAMGGDEGWWGTANSDGRVPLFSAFSIFRLLCTPADPSGPRCRPYPAVVFDSEPNRVFHYNHADLGSPPSTAEILLGTLVPRLEISGPAPAPRLQAANAPDDENPLSPIGASIWGTGARSTGTKGGTLNAFAGGAATQTFAFPVGATDGLALSVFVSDGAGTFTLKDPQGQSVASTSTDDHFVWTVLNPEAGSWTLEVAVDSGSVTFRATSFENSPAGIEAHVTRDRYAPGEAVHYRLDLSGDPGDLDLTAVTATLLSGGSTLETVSLYDDGGHGDGAAGDGTFGGDGTAPALPGSYAVLFSAQGTYDGENVTRIALDSLAVLPPVHAFTGSFADAGASLDDDDPFEALVLTVGLDLPAAGAYALTGDLYDGAGYFLTSATGAFTAPAPGATSRPLLFDLSQAPCASFGAALWVRNLRLREGATLNPLDAWDADVPTASYPASAFDCLPETPGPRVLALSPDEGLQGRGALLTVSGENFASGAAASLGEGISVEEVSVLSPRLLSVRISVSPAAAEGPRDLTVTNPGGASFVKPSAFTVRRDRAPSVVLLSPEEDYVVLGAEPLLVAAAASDDAAVAKVAFLVDGQARKEDSNHPFTFALDPASLASGAHRVTARAYDDAGQTAEVSFLAVKDPPAITAVTKMTAPFRLKLTGQHFQMGAQVFLGSDTAPWPQTTVKNTAKVVLGGGKALKAKFPQGQAIQIRLVNPDGGTCTTTYTRP